MRALLALALMLGGCDGLRPRDDDSAVQRRLDYLGLEDRVAVLERQIREDDELDEARDKYVTAVDGEVDGLRNTVNHNADELSGLSKAYNRHTH